ncbi:hypothetical protein [Pleionea sediminis]|uniref:hypothetical protein n=1 Tax=Pleionea sediminis TaxID=2569479 RepID=UPI001186DEFE|nr:hypothetical protein [Pleionea sediminis]
MAENDEDIFGLEMSQSNCTDSTMDFSSTSSVYANGDEVVAKLSTAFNCAMKAANPKLLVGYHSLTLAINEVSPSGAIAACKCRSEVNFKFQFPEFKKYKIEKIYFTIDGAVQSESKIINKSK